MRKMSLRVVKTADTPHVYALQGIWDSINRNMPGISGIFKTKTLERIGRAPSHRGGKPYVKLIFTDGTSWELTQQDLEAFSYSDQGGAPGPVPQEFFRIPKHTES